ncbi:MAG TPA: hypothetical protein PKL09_02545 [bacterium]|nr:hypothetical protein [bacterium]HNS34454.1 hypothetical protein [bacterium]HNZ73761.1 hypothetical protein [bacterium]
MAKSEEQKQREEERKYNEGYESAVKDGGSMSIGASIMAPMSDSWWKGREDAKHDIQKGKAERGEK